MSADVNQFVLAEAKPSFHWMRRSNLSAQNSSNPHTAFSHNSRAPHLPHSLVCESDIFCDRQFCPTIKASKEGVRLSRACEFTNLSIGPKTKKFGLICVCVCVGGGLTPDLGRLVHG